jgi:hypothetical protein
MWRALEVTFGEYYVSLTGKSFENAKIARNWGAYIKALNEAGADAKITGNLDHIRAEYRNPDDLLFRVPALLHALSSRLDYEKTPASTGRDFRGQVTGRPIFDYALVSTGAISAIVRERYAAEGAEPTRADIERIEAMGIRCITGDVVAEGDVLRHAADRVTDALLTLPCAPQSLGAERAHRVGEQILEVDSPGFLRDQGAAILHSDAA